MKIRVVIFFILCGIQVSAQDIIVKKDSSVNVALKEKNPWSYDFSGFVQADLIFDNRKVDFIDGFQPAYISSNATDYNSYMSLRQSQMRLGFTQRDYGLRGLVEIDFIGGNNRNGFRFRKLFIKYKNWLVGQEWSTLDDMSTWPRIIDFNGPNSGVFSRRAQIRYSKVINKKSMYEVALEDPAIPNVTLPNNNLYKTKSLLPNVVGAFKYGSRSHVRIAGLISPISYSSRANEQENFKTSTKLGFGVNLTSRIYTDSRSSFKLGAFGGRGEATHIITLNGEGYDGRVDPNISKNLNILPIYSFVTTYEHWWNAKWSSVLFYSYYSVGKEQFTSEETLRDVHHASYNVMYQPIKYFKTGAEIIYGYVHRYNTTKQIESTRLQLSAVLMF